MVVVRKERTVEGRDPERTRKAILDAAKELISQEGADAVSVSSVARLAGVNRGTAYLHFKDREELLHATISSVAEELGEIIRIASANIESWSPSDDSVMQSIAKTVSDNAVLAKVWVSETILGDSGEADEILGEWRDGLEVLKDSPQINQDIDYEVLSVIGVASLFLWPILMGVENMSQKQRDKMSKRFGHAFDRIVLEGILKR